MTTHDFFDALFWSKKSLSNFFRKRQNSCLATEQMDDFNRSKWITSTETRFSSQKLGGHRPDWVFIFHGSKVLRILSDQGTELVNQDFKKHARQRGFHLSTSPAHQLIALDPWGNGSFPTCMRMLIAGRGSTCSPASSTAVSLVT